MANLFRFDFAAIAQLAEHRFCKPAVSSSTLDRGFFVTSNQRRILNAAMNRIIPPDDFPGACEGGVGNYIERQLSGDLREFRTEFLEGLNALDAEAVARFGCNFAELSEHQQDEILSAVERGDVKAVWKISPGPFFRRLVNLTMEGFYADPGNGGNRDQISWKMIGYQSK